MPGTCSPNGLFVAAFGKSLAIYQFGIVDPSGFALGIMPETRKPAHVVLTRSETGGDECNLRIVGAYG